jgi:hypothetical protein
MKVRLLLASCYSCLLTYVLDAPVIVKEPSQTVCLPFSFVPGMDVTSRLFRKAQATIAKQASALTPSASTPVHSKKKALEALLNVEQGMYFISLSL